MAKDLNKTRMRDTKILIVLTIMAGLFTKSSFPDDTIGHEVFELAGYILVTACAIGRIYSTAFIGGIKNENLITVGPYSMCRNPLYFYSLLGAAGIGLLSTHVIAFAIIFCGFLLIYRNLIAREEAFLAEKFGQTFENYKNSVPRIIPDLKKYSCPEELVFQPKYLNKSVFDAIWWFVPYPLFELADFLQEERLITPVMSLF